MSAPFEEVLDLYGLQEGDKAVVRLARQAADVEATVTDDRLLYIVLYRCGHEALFLPDLIEKAVPMASVMLPLASNCSWLSVRASTWALSSTRYADWKE